MMVVIVTSGVFLDIGVVVIFIIVVDGVIVVVVRPVLMGKSHPPSAPAATERL